MKLTIEIEKDQFSDPDFRLVGHVTGILENVLGKESVKGGIERKKGKEH